MVKPARSTFGTVVLLLAIACTSVAGDLDTIGWTALNNRLGEPGEPDDLDGSGVTLAQVEAEESDGDWQPSPAGANQDPSMFTCFDGTNPYPVGAAFDSTLESGHANSVANNYYDAVSGTVRAPDAVEAFPAGYFYSGIVVPGVAINAKIVNQSYIYDTENPTTDQNFDHYAASRNVLFVNGVNNGGSTQPPSPATMYNGIAVGLENGDSSTGPTSGGRIKPDIVAPPTLTSYATPYVSGSAALLVQAATRGDGGSGTETASTRIQTLKALLLNGAEKTPTWAPQAGEPLDRTFGAGVLNINRSHLQLSAGMHGPTDTASVETGSSLVPSAGISGRVASLVGWNSTDITTLSTGSGRNRTDFDALHNYHFSATEAGACNLTATLAWNRQDNQSGINNLDLKLYEYGTGALVAESASTVDNLEHVHCRDLPAGEYVLQVVSYRANFVADTETYALAFEFEDVLPPAAPSGLTVAPAPGNSMNLAWSDNSDDESGFLILRSSSIDGTYEEIDSVAEGVTTATDSGLAAGTTYFYRVLAFNAAGESEYAASDGTTFTELESWRLVHFGTTGNTGDAADAFDFDSDTLPNLLEYALGTDPKSAAGADGVAAAPTSSFEADGEDSYLTLTVDRSSRRSDITYQVKVSGDLSVWTDDVTVLADTDVLLKVRDNSPLAASSARFIRLVVRSN